MTLARTVLALVIVVLAAVVAAACPVCMDAGNPVVIEEYRRSTMFLSLLPFGIVGSIVGTGVYLARRGASGDVLNAR